jgi:hypothetical protein
VAQGVDYVALSFVRGPEDIVAARKAVAERGGNLPISAKLERAEAMTAWDAVLVEADGVMIARRSRRRTGAPSASRARRLVSSRSNGQPRRLSPSRPLNQSDGQWPSIGESAP